MTLADLKNLVSGARVALREARDAYRRQGVVEPRRETTRRARDRARTSGRRDDPDVVLDIPHVHVDEIDLQLDELKARVALEAHVLDLLRLDVGVDAELRGVALKIAGVDAEAQLKVRLENLTMILRRVMDTIDANPQILLNLADQLGAVGEAGSQAVGQTVPKLARAAGGSNGRPDAEISARSQRRATHRRRDGAGRSPRSA
jgi:uncharacterized protein involved in outer membrane biogenesis